MKQIERTRVLVVDDSVVMRSLLTRILGSDPLIEVVGSARDGLDALEKVESLRPMLVTLDVEMPVLDGLSTLRLIRDRHPDVRVIMCSSLTERGAGVTIDALLAGASDYVTKQQSSALSADAYEALRVDLLMKIHMIFGRRRAEGQPIAASPAQIDPFAASSVRANAASTYGLSVSAFPCKLLVPRALIIGASTGGPSALSAILPLLPAGFPLPIAIVQHMPPLFTRLLAERLSRICKIPVHEGAQGMEMRPGVAVIAPGDFHMRLVRERGAVTLQMDQGEQENSCRPAVDVLFRSAAEAYGGAVIAMVLTGMGQDGLRGTQALRSLGAQVLVQDRDTSVIWGMPGAIAEARLADAVLPLHDLIPEALRLL